jgi:hypothetical protein
MPDLPGIPVRAIEWTGVELLPGRALNLLLEKGSNHYYRARATESVPLRVWKGNVVDQYEKFLFYRGVGTFAMPLSVQVSPTSATGAKNPCNLLKAGVGHQKVFTTDAEALSQWLTPTG